MTRAELVKALKEKASLATHAQTEAAHDALIAILADALKKGARRYPDRLQQLQNRQPRRQKRP
jgi:nucleoid DNA-binding protein